MELNFVSEVYIKLVALSVNRYPRRSTHLRKGWWPRPRAPIK